MTHAWIECEHQELARPALSWLYFGVVSAWFGGSEGDGQIYRNSICVLWDGGLHVKWITAVSVL